MGPEAIGDQREWMPLGLTAMRFRGEHMSNAGWHVPALGRSRTSFRRFVCDGTTVTQKLVA
jgi:hypothetical protein